MKSDLLQIFKGSVITQSDKDIIINKYTERNNCFYKKISFNFLNDMVNSEIVKLDSGNWETREMHYMLNENFIRYKNDIKYINLKSVTKIVEDGYFYNHISNDFKKAYLSLKKDIERKNKLNKLNGFIR